MSPRPLNNIAILGPGLLGGSIALAVREHLPECTLRLWARREQPLLLAKELGITEHTTLDVQEAVAGAQLVILATTIGAFEELTRQMLPSLPKDAIVTDIGSVKHYVHRTTGALLHERGYQFIGSHPMAGSEQQGLEHAHASLIQGATLALTNEHQVDEEAVAALEHFWHSIGMCPYRIGAKDHDRSVARVSHVPHILAALCARTADMGGVPLEDLQRLAATGFRDTSRVSGGPPNMWASILWENDVAVRETIQYCLEDLQKLVRLLELQDRQGTEEWLREAKESRVSIKPFQNLTPPSSQ